jgi:UTP--glucose-1-phosphate uridylyltransferase
MSAAGIDDGVAKLRADGAGDEVIVAFRHYAELVRSGEQGLIPEAGIEPVEELPGLDELPEPGPDAAALLDATVVIKLNGGLGTSMGMTRAKSLLEVKDRKSFLDIAAAQVLCLRERFAAAAPRIPLVLMNSFATRADSLAALARYDGLAADLPADMVQSRLPKLRDDGTLAPVAWPADPALEWAPPGHGDLYAALAGSGLLATLLERGYRYAFVSNADNLGAVLDPRILAWFAGSGSPFLMEVSGRTAADRKGGHLARRPGGELLLREVAQTDAADMEAFQDITRHRFFNTNSVWLDLRALAAVLDREGFLALPLIVNRKHVDPADPSSPAVIQLETAMGAAIAAFDGAQALCVPRSRFAPVKTTDDLLALRSDAYALDADARLVLDPARGGAAPLVSLDPEYFRLVADFDARFAAGPPSLVRCDALTVRGDVRFGRGVVVEGSVTVGDQDAPAPLVVPDDAVLR